MLVGEDRTGGKQLVGYARSEPGRAAVSPADLRVHLAGRLPAFMVPAHLIVLDTFPLNANGKVDRSKLPAPDAAEDGTSYVAPRTLVETVLTDMYAGLLNLDRVGIEDSFFDLGGNSLQAMQLVTRLRKELAVDTDVTAIFLAPTPAQLATTLRDRYGVLDSDLDDADLDQLGQLSEDEAAALLASLDPAGTVTASIVDAPLVRMTDGPGTEPLFLVHAVGGTVYPFAHLARELADRYAVFGIEAAGLRDGSLPVADLDAMVDRYVAAVRAAQPTGPYRLAGWSMGGLVALEMAGRFAATGDEVALVGLLDSPYEPADMSGWSTAEVAAQFVADASRALGPDAGPLPDPATTGVPEQLRWLADRLGGDAGDGAAALGEIERRFAVFQAHVTAIAGYRARPSAGPVLVVGARDGYDFGPGWTRILGSGAEPVRVPGDHYSFLRPPGVHEVARAIRARLG